MLHRLEGTDGLPELNALFHVPGGNREGLIRYTHLHGRRRDPRRIHDVLDDLRPVRGRAQQILFRDDGTVER